MHKVTKHQMRGAEPAAVTPCHADPDRYFPDEQRPDPQAVAACWSCFFQRDCAIRALTLSPQPEHGIWGGYRLAPGPGLSRSRKQLRIIAGLDMGPARSPGHEIDAVLQHHTGNEHDPAPLKTAEDIGEDAAIDRGSSDATAELAVDVTVLDAVHARVEDRSVALARNARALRQGSEQIDERAEVIAIAERSAAARQTLHRRPLPVTVAHHAPTG